MKRVLLIAYAFPPEPLPGSQRPGYLARYLPRFGWQATVLTPARVDRPPFEVEIAHTGSAHAALERVGNALPAGGALRATLRTIKDALIFPDPLAGWIPPAISTGLRVLRSSRYDAVFSTALPTSAHVIGATLSRIAGVPWLADYRDLWSGNPYMPWGPIKRRLESAAERYIMRRAAQLTTVSDVLAQQLRSLHDKPVTVIGNAYDEAEWAGVPEITPTAFDLVYAGTLYGGKRSPDLLFRALSRLKERGHPAASARIHFYGDDNTAALDRARTFGLESQVHVHGVVPRAEALRMQRASAAVLIFLSMDPSTVNEQGSKYLEYLGARRPMLVFGPKGSVMRETLDALNAGFFVCDVVDAERALCSLYQQFTRGEYAIAADLQAVQTSEQLASRFATCLDEISTFGVRGNRAAAKQTFYKAG